MTDQQMIEKAQAAGYRRTRPYCEYGTHTICRHGQIEKNGKKKHKCIRYALVQNSVQGRSDRPACAVCGASGAFLVEVWDAGGPRTGAYREWKETRTLCETCSDRLTVCEGCGVLIGDNVLIAGRDILCPDCKVQGRSDRPAQKGVTK